MKKGQLVDFLHRRLACSLEQADDGYFDYDSAAAAVLAQFRAESLSALGLDGKALAVRASGALLRYIAETQKCDLGHINELELIEGGKYMELDWARAAAWSSRAACARAKSAAACSGFWTTRALPWARGCCAPGWRCHCSR